MAGSTAFLFCPLFTAHLTSCLLGIFLLLTYLFSVFPKKRKENYYMQATIVFL